MILAVDLPADLGTFNFPFQHIQHDLMSRKMLRFVHKRRITLAIWIKFRVGWTNTIPRFHITKDVKTSQGLSAQNIYYLSTILPSCIKSKSGLVKLNWGCTNLWNVVNKLVSDDPKFQITYYHVNTTSQFDTWSKYRTDHSKIKKYRFFSNTGFVLIEAFINI